MTLVFTVVTGEWDTNTFSCLAGRKRSLSLDSPQQYQVNTASIPALVSQVTVNKAKKR